MLSNHAGAITLHFSPGRECAEVDRALTQRLEAHVFLAADGFGPA